MYTLYRVWMAPTGCVSVRCLRYASCIIHLSCVCVCAQVDFSYSDTLGVILSDCWDIVVLG